MNDTYKNLPRDTFLYLLAIITLVASAVSFGTLVFQYINVYFPDPISSYYGYGFDSSFNVIRYSLSALLVIFPVFYWVSRFLRKDVEANPEKREIKIRKWLLYLTVFAASLVIIGDFIAIINSFLQGELTVRFILKALTVLFIAGSAFYYYLSNIKERALKHTKILSKIIVMTVVAAVVAGFVIAGSPVRQREKRFDELRINGLQTIQNEIINYWQNNERLPQNLDALENSISGFRPPRDPQTDESYEYKIISPLIFELCAKFNAPSSETENRISVPKPVYPGEGLWNWSHDAGRQCFERTIDPNAYPVRAKQ